MRKTILLLIQVSLLSLIFTSSTLAVESSGYKVRGSSQDFVYRHFKMGKSRGKVSSETLERTKKVIEDHLNSLDPGPGHVHGFISEGANSRDIHLWVRKGHSPRTWKINHLVFYSHRGTPGNITRVLKQRNKHFVILGVDGAKTQSIYFLSTVLNSSDRY